MILTVIQTDNKKLNLNFDIEFEQPIDLRATGVDENDNKTTFFNRLINPDKKLFSVDFPLPISPKKLLITFNNETNGDDSLYKIVSIGADYLENNGVDLTQFDYKTIEWIKKFCKEASYLPDGEYRELGGKVWINYMPQINDPDLGIVETPARVDHETGEIQINSTKFRTYTIPIRMVMLMHEYSHWRHDNTDETFCDLEALRICLGLGFPKTECIYTFTNILNESHQNNVRMKQIVNYINNYK